jgi:hypothetical protein
MNKYGLNIVTAMIIAMIASTSCTNERLFTQSRYKNLDKVPVTEIKNVEEIKPESELHSDLQNIAEVKADDRSVPSNEIMRVPEPKQTVKIDASKLLKVSKLIKQIDRNVFKNSLTENNGRQRVEKNTLTIDEKKTKAGKIISKIKSIVNYPPEKIIVYALIALIAIMLIILLSPVIVWVLTIAILTLLVLALIHYLY